MNPLNRRWRCYGNAVFHRAFVRWLWQRVWLDDIPGRAAQLSYYLLLALFPLLICLSALLGYFFAAQSSVEPRLMDYFGSMMPRASFDIVRVAMDDLAQARGGGKLSFGLFVALWLASAGMEAVIEGLNVASQAIDTRPWWRRRLVALGLTTTVAMLAGCALGLVVAGGWSGKTLTDLVGLGDVWRPVWRVSQWLASFAFLLGAINLIYFFGPNLETRRRARVILPGAIVALVCWIAASAGLRLYLDHSSSFGRTYGSLGAVIALLFWLYWSGAALLLGAEINSGIEERLAEPHG